MMTNNLHQSYPWLRSGNGSDYNSAIRARLRLTQTISYNNTAVPNQINTKLCFMCNIHIPWTCMLQLSRECWLQSSIVAQMHTHTNTQKNICRKWNSQLLFTLKITKQKLYETFIQLSNGCLTSYSFCCVKYCWELALIMWLVLNYHFYTNY